MRVAIMMIFDEGEYTYGIYPFDTGEEKDKVNELSMKIRSERGCRTYIKKVGE